MATARVRSRISHAEIKAGVFLTFCLALFIAMLFVLGRFGREWRGRQEIRVVFTKINGLPTEAPVFYNGMQVGHVKAMKLRRLTAELLQRMPAFTRRDLPSLPLSDDERIAFRESADGDEEFDKKLRELVRDRSVSVLLLDLLNENDAQRFHVDDEYRITGSLTGDRAVAVRSGSGGVVPLQYDKVFLGHGGDIYTDLGKSVAQIRDILASMAEMVGGDSGKSAIHGQLANFDDFTRRLDEATASLETKLPTTWDTLDARIDTGQKQLTDVEGKILKFKPELAKALEDAQKSIAEARADFNKSIGPVQDQLRDGRKSVSASLDEARKLAAESREKIPEQIRDLRAWTEKLTPSVAKIESALDRTNAALSENIDTTRAALQAAVSRAQALEELTFRLKRKPHAVAGNLEPAEEQALEGEWRRSLVERQHAELRQELGRLQNDLKGLDPARSQRVEQLLRGLDAGGEPVEPKKKEKR